MNAERWMAVCTQRVATCGSSLMDCMRTGDCYGPWIRPEIFANYIGCFETRACEARDDPCISAAIDSLTGGSSYTAGIASECAARFSACGLPSAESCAVKFFDAVLPTHLERYRACLAVPCDQIRGCFQMVRPATCNG